MASFYYNLNGYFENIVQRHSNNTALKYSNCDLNVSYIQLNNMAYQLARYLLDNGITKGDVVAIFNNKSELSFALMFACLKIGVIYTNLDDDCPAYRLKNTLDTCKAKILFFESNVPNGLKELIDNEQHTLAILEQIKLGKYSDKAIELNYKIHGNTPAYIMFTSGSTGTPKGVAITHANLINFIHWSIPRFEITPDDIFANVSPLYFDNSVFDIYSCLFSGATLAPIQKKTTKKASELVHEVDALKCSVWFSVPSLLIFLSTFKVLTKNTFASIRVISFGGEGFPKATLSKIFKLYSHRTKFINVYGPTEGTCICSSYDVTADDFNDTTGILPLGTINSSFDYRIVNENLTDVLAGEQGELCLKGPNIALGYYNDLSRTQDVFVKDPKQSNYTEILYKTGDIVYQNEEDGFLYFVSRIDNQIKHMGYRIELDEIEHAIHLLPYVAQAAVTYKRVNKNFGKIFAFVVCTTSNLTEKDIIDDLMAFIPDYMLPNEINFLDNLPKNPNGKVDRKSL